MTRIGEERRVLLMFALTDLLLYWITLSVVTPGRLETLIQVDFFLIRRDRLVCVLLFAAAALITGAYKPASINDRFDSVYYTLIALLATGIAELLLTAVLPVHLRAISRRELILSTPLGAILLGIWRYHAAGLAARFGPLHRFFYVLGSKANAERIAIEINRNPSVRAEARYISLKELKEKVARRKAAEGERYFATEDAIIALTTRNRKLLEEMLLFCRENCRRTFIHPSLHDTFLFPHSRLLAVAGIPLVEVGTQHLSSPYLYIKRCVDFAVAAVGLVLALPLCVVMAIAIKLTSPGGVLYVQERLGKGGRPFRIYKFRSMFEGEELKDESGYVLAKEDDPRITPVGRIIRKHRMDEIPQLFNVLKGDMSLIGPRPTWRESYQANRDKLPLFEQRLAVRPGLTCLSHVLGSYASEPEDRLRYDLIYISTLSLITDLRVLTATVRIVLSGKGAQ